MALSRQQKEEAVAEVTQLLTNAKLVAFASYEGLTVAQSQALRAKASENSVTVKVVKNRLVKQAASKIDGYKEADLSPLVGQMIYAFSSDDEVAPAQTFAEFSKKNPALKLTGALEASGKVMDEAEVNQLASLPSKDQLRGQLVSTIAAPLSGFVNVLSGNIRGLVNVLNARSAEMNS